MTIHGDINWIFQGGKLHQEVTSITLVNNTQKIQDVTVPTGKRWLLLGVKMNNPDDVARVLSVEVYKEAAKTNHLKRLFQWSAVGAGNNRYWPTWPSGAVAGAALYVSHLVILEVGNTLECTWETGGASTGGVAVDGLVVEYLEVDV